jgi:hypothetical protein
MATFAPGSTCCGFTSNSKGFRGDPGWAAIQLSGTGEQFRLNLMKESERDPAREASDRKRRERLLQADKDSGSEASQQGSEADQKQREKRRLIGQVVRSAPWI